MHPCFYIRDGDGFMPTRLAASPWEFGKQNGVGLGGLATAAVETIPAPAAMTTARLTIDILAAAPMEHTTARTRVLREGKRIQMVEAELVVGDRAVARATALRVRQTETPPFAEPNAYPPPESVPEVDFMDARAFGGTIETRKVSGALREPGPGVLWVRFGHDHIADEPLTPLLRAAMLGDFGGGLGSVLDSGAWTYANLDITLHLTREPVGEWLLVDAATASAGTGVGRSDMILADTRGPFARAHQTLFVAPR
ncbi:thioesterase family protein [Sphingomonas immobilis]|uniref:Thioesterase family protein n=1 Tax=Sphingomonas immobilis TaxID=3063997 RepID=A0ABT8ZXC6_9SPHN|nr:thioesterase family protein [Sphingomonas sp. CA1-15]MDO7842221.1 thioesterase family protein [Sphingomonas sp. CA1-15]